MDESMAADYLNTNHSEHFTKKVSPYTVKRWYGQNRFTELSKSSLDDAIKTRRIPPKKGRPSRFSIADKEDIIAASELLSRDKVAKIFGCSSSYVSLLVRGLR